MNKLVWLGLTIISLNALAMDFRISPFISYDDMRDDFVKDDATSVFKVQRSGTVFGIEGSVYTPVVLHNLKNNIKAGFGYGVLDGNSIATNFKEKTSNLKTWKMMFEDTIAYFSKVSSRTAPYIGIGYSYDKYRIDNNVSDFYPNSVAALQDNSGNLQGTNKRFYIPLGFVVKATDSFSLDLRYEKDMLAKLNKSQVYIKDADPNNPRKFDKGGGIALILNWDFKPMQNTGITAKFARHAVDYSGTFESLTYAKKQKQAENIFLVQLHWLG